MTHDQDTTPVSIYALCEPDTGEVRYIGATRLDPAQRLKQHVSTADPLTGPRGAWLHALHTQGLAPTLRVLAVVSFAQARQAEQDHIAAHLAQGCRLTNYAVQRYYPHRSPPGRVPTANTAKTSFKLPPELLEWAVAQPEGMSALIRSLLERERARRVA